MRFVAYEHPNGVAAPHLAQAHASTTERLFLRKHALSYPALNDQINAWKPERIIVGARAVWQVVALELEGAARSGRLCEDDVKRATELCHEIRLAVLRNRFHYHGIG